MDRSRAPWDLPNTVAPATNLNGDVLDIFIRRLAGQSSLSNDDRRALRSLPHSVRRVEQNDHILREGDRADICPILLSGFAYRHKLAADGGRQLVAIKIPGEPLDLQSLHLRVADHNLQALTAGTLAMVPLAELEALAALHPAISRALTVDILIEASIGREWLLNIGRRNALARLAHLLCELVHRLQLSGEPSLDEIDMPFTQEQLADLLGLTAVHINRTLKTLEDAGGVRRSGRRLMIGDAETLCRIASYSDIYLHRDNAAA